MLVYLAFRENEAQGLRPDNLGGCQVRRCGRSPQRRWSSAAASGRSRAASQKV